MSKAANRKGDLFRSTNPRNGLKPRKHRHPVRWIRRYTPRISGDPRDWFPRIRW